jgi:hypothetical protein
MKKAAVVLSLFLLPAFFFLAQDALEHEIERRKIPERNLAVCKSQLVLIYSELKAYADQHGGRFPSKLSDLIVEGYDSNPNLFVCPNSNDLFVNANTRAGEAAEMNRPGHDSYRYYGYGLTESSPPDSILIAEPPENHASLDGHVALLNGEIHSLDPSELRSIVAKHTTLTTENSATP